MKKLFYELICFLIDRVSNDLDKFSSYTALRVFLVFALINMKQLKISGINFYACYLESEPRTLNKAQAAQKCLALEALVPTPHPLRTQDNYFHYDISLLIIL